MKELTVLEVLELARKDALEVGEDRYASKIGKLINEIKRKEDLAVDEYQEATRLLNEYSSKNSGIDLLNDGMYNYLLGKQSVLRDVLQEQMTPRDFYELEFNRE